MNLLIKYVIMILRECENVLFSYKKKGKYMTVLTESALTGNIPASAYIIAAAVAAVVIIAAIVMGVISKKKK